MGKMASPSRGSTLPSKLTTSPSTSPSMQAMDKRDKGDGRHQDTGRGLREWIPRPPPRTNMCTEVGSFPFNHTNDRDWYPRGTTVQRALGPPRTNAQKHIFV